jgi:hypothetical protein
MPKTVIVPEVPQRSDRPLVRSLAIPRLSRLPFFTRYAFRFHVRAEALQGIYQAIFELRGYVARKTLGATAAELAFITSIPTLAQTFAMTWQTVLRGVDRRKALLWTGVFGKGLFFLVALVTGSLPFAILCGVLAIVDSAYVPLRNLLYQSNYSKRLRGVLFSTAFAVMIGVNLVTSLAATTWLDHSPPAYRWLYPLAAAAGIAVHVLYARARLRHQAVSRGGSRPQRGTALRRAGHAVTHPLKLTRSLLRRDSRFRAFEQGFVLYGITYLMNDVLTVFLATDVLGASYKQISIAQTVIPMSLMMLCFPIWGRFLDRTSPLRVAAAAFFAVGMWAMALALSRSIPMLYAAGALRGISMAGLNVVWNLGPMHLAPRGKARDYMGVHVTLVGVRGLIGPPLAIVLREALGVHAALAVGGLFALAAAIFTAKADRAHPAPHPAAESAPHR